VSELGDWFYSLAVYDLLIETTHSGKAVGWAIVVSDRFLGRVFALVEGVFALTASASTYAVGVSLDTWRLSARQIAGLMGAAVTLPGLLWLPAQAAWAKRTETLDH
jgi:hypothetical protein